PRPLLPRVPGHRWRLAALGGVALLFALLLGGAGGTSALCGDGTLREACRALGLGGVPSRDDESAWAAARHAVQETGSGEGYRRYLREQPAGSFAALAQAGLAACTEVAEVRWQRRDDPLPLVVNAGSSPAPDETAARANSAAEVQRQADALCASYGKSPAYRLLGAAPEAPGWRCRESRRGWTCAFDGRAVCQLEVRSTVAREHCV
ncbi:MAG TPA: hypothetical protein PLJ14_13115, partial [Accumulibacter sp.]|nr:hypothetical protein [Accumulibacter sp.]